jgi:hypothetical protein
VEDTPHTKWFDNFSKVYGAQIPSIDIGSWRNCLWTGVALKQYTGEDPISVAVMKNAAGEVIPAMPDDPFEYADQLKELVEEHTPRADYRTHSLVFRWNVTSVPLKPVPSQVENRKWRRALLNSGQVSQLFPKELIAENIGSNLGLARIMKEHYNEHKQNTEHDCTKYSVLLADVNIFDRVLKVCLWFVSIDSS